MKDKVYATVDLGGSKIYTVLSTSCGERLSSYKEKTQAAASTDLVLDQITHSVLTVLGKAGCSRSRLSAVGVCVAGFFDCKERIIVNSPNLRGWVNIQLEKELSKRLGVTVLAENDANAAAIGEVKYGAGRGFRDAVFITVSTGIGAGLVLDNKIYRGTRGFAGEIGHMEVNPGGLNCGCGLKGCLETISSGKAMTRAVREAVSKNKNTVLRQLVNDNSLLASHIFAAAEKGDRVASEIICQALYYLGIGLVNIINLLNPEVIIIGGGVAEAGESLLAPLRDSVNSKALAASAASVIIKKAELGVEAGVIGMLSLLQEHSISKD